MPVKSPAFMAKPVQLLEADAWTTSAHKGTMDCRGFRHLMILANIGTIGGTLTIEVQEGDASDGSDSAALSPAVNFGTLASDTVYWGVLFLAPRKRYISVVGTPVTSAADFGVVGVLFNPIQEPINSPAPVFNVYE